MFNKIISSNFLDNPISVAEQKWGKDTLPLVSICCLTYNHENYIHKAIEGFMMQKTSFPVEILIHDDASSDGTADVVRKYVQNAPEIIFPVYQNENQFSQGNNPFVKFLLPRARGSYIAWCEGDDYWIDSLKLQKQIDIFVKYPDTILCGARAQTWNENNKEFTVITPAHDKDITCMTPEQFFNLGDWVKTCTRIGPKALMENVPLTYFRDYMHVHYVMAKNPNGRFRCLNEVVAIYREHVGGIFSGADLVDAMQYNFKSKKLVAKLFSDERAIVMRENAAGIAKELLLNKSLKSKERAFYAFHFIVLHFNNISFLGAKRASSRVLQRLFACLNKYLVLKLLLRYFYDFARWVIVINKKK